VFSAYLTRADRRKRLEILEEGLRKTTEKQEGHLGRRRKGREMNVRRTVNGSEGAKSLFPIKILLATDGSADAVQATEAAVDLAGRGGSQLHVVHVWQDVPTSYAHAFVKQELERQGQEILEEQVRRIDADGGAAPQDGTDLG
jgi:universal stress protein family protein